ncbi:MAG: S8 family serine peptidase [Bradymonadia bacterium]
MHTPSRLFRHVAALGAATVCALGVNPGFAQRGGGTITGGSGTSGTYERGIYDQEAVTREQSDRRAEEDQREEERREGLEVIIDDTLRHASHTRSGRPLAGVLRPNGTISTFVDNELIVQTDDFDLLRGIVDSLGGEITQRIVPGRHGLAGVPSTFLVRLDPTQESWSRLGERLDDLNDRRPGEARISSERGASLLAIAAALAMDGISVGVNWQLTPQAIPDGVTTEGVNVPWAQQSGFVGVNSTVDAFQLNYMNSGSNQDIGVDVAWQAMASAGVLNPNTITIGVIDGGFFRENNPDFPHVVGAAAVDPWADAFEEPNPIPCGGGNACPTHGADVVAAAMGIVDNGFGAAGPAGPVADAVVINRSEWLMIDSLGTVPHAAVMGADIINMSYSVDVVWWISWTLYPFEAVTAATRASGTLLFAAAGNDNENVDRETCFLGACWEVEWTAPCENAGVICVGGLGRNSQFKAGFSVFGQGKGDSVDIWGPGTVLVPETPIDPNAPGRLDDVSGTSFASPFVAGVAALIWAADPGQSANTVESRLLNNAHPSPDDRVNRIVNARGSVFEVLGIDMLLDITLPGDGQQIHYGQPTTFSANALDRTGDAPTVTWALSNGVGVIGTGNPISDNAFYPLGPITVTAKGVGSTGNQVTDNVTATVVAPDLTLSPTVSRLSGGNLRIGGEASNIGDGRTFASAQITVDVLATDGSVVTTDSFFVPPISPGFSTALSHVVDMSGLPHPGCGGTVRLHINPFGPGSLPEPYAHQLNNEHTVGIGCADLYVSQFEPPTSMAPPGNGFINFTAPLTFGNKGAVDAEGFERGYSVYDAVTGSLLFTASQSAPAMASGSVVQDNVTFNMTDTGSTEVINGHVVRRYTLVYALDLFGAVVEESESNNIKAETLVVTDNEAPEVLVTAPAIVHVPWGEQSISMPFSVWVNDADDPAAALSMDFKVGAGGVIANDFGGAVPQEGELNYSVSYPTGGLFSPMCYAPGGTYTASRTIEATVTDGILSAHDDLVIDFILNVPDTPQTQLAWDQCTGIISGENDEVHELPEWMMTGLPIYLESWCWAAQPSPMGDDPCMGLYALSQLADGLWDPIDRTRLEQAVARLPRRDAHDPIQRLIEQEMTQLGQSRAGRAVELPVTHVMLTESLVERLVDTMSTVRATERGGRGALGMGWSAEVAPGDGALGMRLTPIVMGLPRGVSPVEGQAPMRVDELSVRQADRVSLSVQLGEQARGARLYGLTEDGIIDLTSGYDLRSGTLQGRLQDGVWAVMAGHPNP